MRFRAESRHFDAGAKRRKAKQILSDLINTLGGPGYTEVRESQCEGRRVLFGHSGDVIGNIGFTEFRRFPDKVRTEYIGKSHHNILPYLVGIDGLDLAHGGVVITLYNGDQGWTFDRSGVNELPAASISEFQEQVKRNIDNLCGCGSRSRASPSASAATTPWT